MNRESTTDELSRVMWRFVERYASTIGAGDVAIEKVDSVTLRRQCGHLHPTMAIKTDRRSRRISYCTELATLHLSIKVRREKVEQAPKYLIHELTHIVWPTWPRTPETEWESGMMAFEVLWIERIALEMTTGSDPRLDNLVDSFRFKLRSYAVCGSPLAWTPRDNVVETMRKVCRDHKLPLPPKPIGTVLHPERGYEEWS